MVARFLICTSLVVLATISGCATDAGDGADPGAGEALSAGGDLDNIIARAKGDGDTPGIKFVPAADTSQQKGRPGKINYVVIHDIEGSGSSAVNTFQTPNSEQSSAHYVIDKNGKAVQMVREADIANHAFHSVLNAYAIGIEHSGHMAANEYTQAEYDASAALVAQIVKRYGIPIDRQHIVGHYQVPKTDDVVDACGEKATNCGGQAGHADPGAHWDWNSYLALIQQKAKALGYGTADPAEQAARKLTWIKPMDTLKFSKEIFGGYWATQCSADQQTQTTFRTIDDPKGARAETRYLQKTASPCGEAGGGGVFPIVFHGLPVQGSSRADQDLKGLSVEECLGGKKRVYSFSGKSVACASGGSCQEPTVELAQESEGC
jgi:N-acetyl-anhydromuramyl-L-alanine amidase AmpD